MTIKLTCGRVDFGSLQPSFPIQLKWYTTTFRVQWPSGPVRSLRYIVTCTTIWLQLGKTHADLLPCEVTWLSVGGIQRWQCTRCTAFLVLACYVLTPGHVNTCYTIPNSHKPTERRAQCRLNVGPTSVFAKMHMLYIYTRVITKMMFQILENKYLHFGMLLLIHRIPRPFTSKDKKFVLFSLGKLWSDVHGLFEVECSLTVSKIVV